MRDYTVIQSEIRRLLRLASEEKDLGTGFKGLCEAVGVAKMYYDVFLGSKNRYRNLKNGQLQVVGNEQEGKLVLFDSGKKTGISKTYTYYYDNLDYVHAYIEFEEGIKEEDLDTELLDALADFVYILTSRRNMRLMLDFSEISDAQTGIPNMIFINRKYRMITARIPAENYHVLRINIKNFKFINETAGAHAGDEAIIKYSVELLGLIEDDEGVCRMGGDNFCMFVKKENLRTVLDKLESVSLTDFDSAPGAVFEMAAWVGVSGTDVTAETPFGARLEEASLACELAKTRIKKNVVFFDQHLSEIGAAGRRTVADFKPAVQNHEFRPFFQAKVDMRTGLLVGFEALCRWIHNGELIFPDKFIPVLEKEGLIPELDMAILNETCISIRKWMEKGLRPPRISVNFSKKNLFIPEIEEKILKTVTDNGLEPSNIEIEITETSKESHYERLIDFVNKLKKMGFHISVDDFGTGYSSISLIHNIDADVIKIDKCFVDKLPGDKKSTVLIESVVSIVDRLNMSTIAEGVETKEQGEALLTLGCHLAQGYYYSKPVDFEAATALIENPPFEPIE